MDPFPEQPNQPTQPSSQGGIQPASSQPTQPSSQGGIQPGVSQPTQPGAQQKTCIWAILSLICAFIFWPLGVIFGIVALVQISKDPNLKGKGLAIAGIIVSVVLLPMLMIIGSLAYFGVMSPGSSSSVLPMRCEFSAGLDCTEAPLADAEAGTITFPVTNSMGYTITGISASSTTCKSGSSSMDPLRNGDSAVITLTGCDLSDERYSETTNIEYTSEATGMQHTANGIVSGKVQ